MKTEDYYCVKMAKCRIMQTMPRDSPGTRFFYANTNIPCIPPVLKVTHLLSKTTISTNICL